VPDGPAGSLPIAPPRPARRRLLALAFVGIALAGMLGGAIGYGLVVTSCHDTPIFAERLLQEEVPGFDPAVPSCDLPALGAAVLGTAVTGIGAGIVAMLMLQAAGKPRRT
jgi:hypothetical protein